MAYSYVNNKLGGIDYNSFSTIYPELIGRSSCFSEIATLYQGLFLNFKPMKNITLNKLVDDLANMIWTDKHLTDRLKKDDHFAENCNYLRLILVEGASTPPMVKYLMALGKDKFMERINSYV